MNESNHPSPVVERRLYTCCPNAGCQAFREGLSFLHSFGVEPEITVDDDGHHYFGFSIPVEWAIEQRREFNHALADKVSSDIQPCDHCGNVMHQNAAWATCNGCGNRYLVCEECLTRWHGDLCGCDESDSR